MKEELEHIGKYQEMPHERTSMTFKLKCLREQGYDKEFGITDDGLKSYDTGEVFQPGDVSIIEHQRFEGISDPDDMAILYVVETKSGLKGTIVASYGTYGDNELLSFMNHSKDLTQDNLYNDCICEK